MGCVLIIDDQPSILLLLRRVLQGAGYEVISATDGPSGLEAARQPQVEVILTDLSMPGHPSGVELIQSLRAARPDCPVAVLSGFHSDEAMQACRAIGVIDFIEKPFDLAAIRTLIAELRARRTSA